MYGFDQIGSTLGDFIYAVLHPSVANLPAGFLVLVFAVLMIAALPEGARQKDAIGQPGGGRTDRQSVPDLAGDLGDPALTAQLRLRSRRPPPGGRFLRARGRGAVAIRSIAGANPRRAAGPTQRTPSLRRTASLLGEGSGVPVKLALSGAISPQAE